MTSGAMVAVIIVSALVVLAGILLLLFFFRRLKAQRLERESLVFIQEPADVYREELNDSFMEQALWRCGVCKFLNHPERKLCDLCQTLRGADRDVSASKQKKQTHRPNRSTSGRGSLSRGSLSSAASRMGRIGETEAYSSHADDAIGGSFSRASLGARDQGVQTTSKLSKLQLAASRRQQWKRMPTTDGLHRWVRQTQQQRRYSQQRGSLESDPGGRMSLNRYLDATERDSNLSVGTSAYVTRLGGLS